MNKQRNPLDGSTSTDRFAELHIGPAICPHPEDQTLRQAFNDWMDRELELLLDRFSDDVTPNSLRNSLLRDR